MPFILEGIVTTANHDGTPHIAPMGPTVDGRMERLTLRPFQSSTTYGNLKRSSEGVFHIIDDVLLLAQAAIGKLHPSPEMISCDAVSAPIIAAACRWYAFRIESTCTEGPRAEMRAMVVASGRTRDFLGFNRGKHAVVEAAILATRVGILPHNQILAELPRLEELVVKTGGPQEQRAFDLLHQYITDC